jgi:hypothetical protein
LSQEKFVMLKRNALAHSALETATAVMSVVAVAGAAAPALAQGSYGSVQVPVPARPDDSGVQVPVPARPDDSGVQVPVPPRPFGSASPSTSNPYDDQGPAPDYARPPPASEPQVESPSYQSDNRSYQGDSGSYQDQRRAYDERYRQWEAQRDAWAHNNCVNRKTGNTFAGALFGGILGAVAGSQLGGRGERTEASVAGGALGAFTGGAIANSASGPCPEGYAVADAAPPPPAAPPQVGYGVGYYAPPPAYYYPAPYYYGPAYYYGYGPRVRVWYGPHRGWGWRNGWRRW